MIFPYLSKEKALSQDEGITYNSKFGFAPLLDTKRFGAAIHAIKGFNFYVVYYYRVTVDLFLQVSAVVTFEDDDPEEEFKEAFINPPSIIIQSKYDDDLSLKENLLMIITEIKYRRALHDGSMKSFESDIISQAEFQSVVDNIESKRSRFAKSDLLEYMKIAGLEPRVHNYDKGMYVSKCVTSGNHFLYISIKPDREEWGCGYCCKKGGLVELQNWVTEKKVINHGI